LWNIYVALLEGQVKMPSRGKLVKKRGGCAGITLLPKFVNGIIKRGGMNVGRTRS